MKVAFRVDVCLDGNPHGDRWEALSAHWTAQQAGRMMQAARKGGEDRHLRIQAIDGDLEYTLLVLLSNPALAVG